ncbi:MAG: phosphoribosyl-ATP diphosphatase [Paracoccaceae bacterium]
MTLHDLERIIAARAQADPSSSWTAKLLAKGPEKCAEKFGEEAIEAVIEAVRNDPDALASEAADVLFHLLVMLHARGVRVDQVMDVLAARQAQSGLAEKAARPKP